MKKKRVLDNDDDVEVAGEQFVEEYLIKPTYDQDGVQASSGIGLDGKEYPDPVPMAPPVGFNAPPDLMEMMRNMLRSEAYQRRLDEEGFDTFEEAGDYDVEDDPLPPLTPHEAILAGPPVDPPPSNAAVPQVMVAKEGGEEAGSPNKPAPAAPSDQKVGSNSSTST